MSLEQRRNDDRRRRNSFRFSDRYAHLPPNFRNLMLAIGEACRWGMTNRYERYEYKWIPKDHP